ncbi:MAG: hypothetical protein J6T05_00810 [Prevotella sp.]|nr:hypothetical protein [Prevotella sp.]
MKTNRFFVIVAAAALLMTSCSNENERMLTIVNEDGTCSREMTFHPAKEHVMAPLSEPINANGMIFRSGWERTWSVVGDSVRHACPMTQQQSNSLDENAKILMHTRQEYSSVNQMCDSLNRVAQELFKDTATLEKHFKWFYTDYVYKETLSIAIINQAFLIPLERFVSADTASYWFTGEPNLAEGLTGAEQKEMLDDIESKISHWLTACTMAHACQIIANEQYDEVKNPPVSKEQFEALRDSIAMLPAVADMDLLFNTKEQACKILEDFFHSDAYTPLFKDENVWNYRLEENNKYISFLLTMKPMLDYVMPGKVIDAGNGVVEGNVVRYRFSGERLIPHPYDVTITSRVTNVWAFVVTALVILLAIGCLFYRRIRIRIF